MVATNVSGETIGGESNADNMSSISADEFIICRVKSVPSSRFVPMRVGKLPCGTICDQRAGTIPPGPSMTGSKETFMKLIFVVTMACSSASVLAARRHAKVSFVPAKDAHAGTAATYCCQLPSLRSGPKIFTKAADSKICGSDDQ